MGKEDVARIYNGMLFSHKADDIMPLAATWVDLRMVILSEVSQTEKDKYYMISLTRGTLKMIQTNLYTKQKQSQTEKTNLRLSKWRG